MLTDTVSKICVTVLIIAALASTVVLAWHGTFDGAQTLGVIVSIIALPSALFAHSAAVHAAAKRGA